MTNEKKWIKVPKVVNCELQVTTESFMPEYRKDVVFVTQTGRKILGYWDGGAFRSPSEITIFRAVDVSHWFPVPELN